MLSHLQHCRIRPQGARAFHDDTAKDLVDVQRRGDTFVRVYERLAESVVLFQPAVKRRELGDMDLDTDHMIAAGQVR